MVIYDNEYALIYMFRDEWDEICPTVVEDLAVAAELLIEEDMPKRAKTLLALMKHLAIHVHDPNFTQSITSSIVELDDEDDNDNEPPKLLPQ